jgi:hypothetical protein
MPEGTDFSKFSIDEFVRIQSCPTGRPHKTLSCQARVEKIAEFGGLAGEVACTKSLGIPVRLDATHIRRARLELRRVENRKIM